MHVVDYAVPDVTGRGETGVVDVVEVTPGDGAAAGAGGASSLRPSARGSWRRWPSAVTHVRPRHRPSCSGLPIAFVPSRAGGPGGRWRGGGAAPGFLAPATVEYTVD
ncbi:hypothetical protein GCM10020366_71010 [Saccharopolyspora gregorii]|uniref:Uncharacterized protein n=1 Tax=Saccharopolyspora gregorii TaxID=33914 RepID=A0ABP6S346_9PSEU